MVSIPRTVVFLLESLSGGGAERNALTLIRSLASQGWRVVLILQRETGGLIDELPVGTPKIVLQTGRPLGVLRIAARLATVLQQLQADLLFTSLSRPNAVAGLAKLLFRIPTPWVPSEHNNLARILVTQPVRFRWKRSLVHRLLYPKAAAIVSVSHGLAHCLQHDYGLPGQSIHTIHNPIDGSDIEQILAGASRTTRTHGPPRIVACGRLIHQKGFDLLLEALARVRLPQLPELVIVGEGARRPELEQQARDLGLEGRVRFTGFLTQPWQELARGDLFVLSSRWEGFGNVLIEAMACGLPVIASDCDFGPREILTDGENGLLVPPEDPLALAESITRVLSDPGLAARLAERGRQRARDFSTERIVPQYAALFEQVIQQAAPGRREA